MVSRFVLTLCLSLFLIRCGGGENKPVVEGSGQVTSALPSGASSDAGETPSPGSVETSESPTFSGPTFQDVRPIFQSKCQACHIKGSGLPVWTNYAEAFSKSSRIHDRAVVKKDMPPAGAPQLTSEEIETIDQWIESGAVESAPQVVQQQTDDLDDESETSGEMQATTVVSPVSVPVELEGTRLECKTTTRYATKGVAKNRYLSAIFGEDLLGSRIYSTSVNLDPLGRIQTTENIAYLKSSGVGIMELCHQTVLDNQRCSIEKNILDISNGTLNITCPYIDNTIHMNIKIKDGHATIQCLNQDFTTLSEHNNCRIINP